MIAQKTLVAFKGLVLIYHLASAATAHSQTLGDIPQSQRERLLPQLTEMPSIGSVSEQVTDSEADNASERTQANINRRSGTYGPVSVEQQASEVAPFGADLFEGGFRGLRSDGLNPNYRILPGDQITVRLWGAKELDRVLPVDAQGNIFIPSVGPVRVEGVTQAQLDTVIESAAQSVYPNNVQVYTNLQGVQPIGVFVTGFVQRPGRYVGVPSDSLLYLLDQASGIDAELGSYRDVELRRDGKTIAQVDLYDFLLSGQLQHPQLQDGDTLFVNRRGPAVTVLGDVRKPYLFELTPETSDGSSLVKLAPLSAGVSHALVRGARGTRPFFEYRELSQLNDLTLADGDEVLFFVDQPAEQVVIQLEGAYLGRSYHVVPKGTTLHELLNGVPVNPQETAYQSVSIRRESVAERQREALEDSLRRLETTYLGASSETAEESAIRAREAELISRFVDKASQVEPNGRLVVAHDDQLIDIRLQDGDVVTLPQRTDSVLVSGEVYIPQSLVFVEGRTVEDYIASAGGYSQHADPDHVLIARQNGEIKKSDQTIVHPGDQILVLAKVETKNVQLASSITQILFQIAVATRVALDL